ncbi:type 2 periplasmic-binding domain-containing protein [Paenibacillus cymbidii]|uniref:extracellular solute-binding protein n=1 Tax=Paenibacillus cymbidii TaxID=1639034 RepID=UPI001080A6D0|nr:extracellular solute-binding protein [Paenibacillus cymbidii]
MTRYTTPRTATIAKSVAVWIALALVSGACRAGGGEGAAAGDAASPAPNAAAGQQPRLKLVWAAPFLQTTASLPPAEQDFVKQTIDRKFHVDFTLLPMTGSAKDTENAINIKLAAGDPLDLFVYPGVNSNKLIKDGAVKELTPWLNKQRVPNYFRWVDEQELQYYQVQNVFKRAPFPFPRTTLGSYYIRKDWLDKLQLPVPRSYEEMVEAMKAFTFRDPDGNGKNDTYGFTTAGNGQTVSFEFPVFLKNGLQTTYWVENDKLRVAKYDAALGQAIDDLLLLLQLNVVDPDWFLNRSAQTLEKAVQGKAGIIQSWDTNIAFDNNPNGLLRRTKETTGVAAADWEPFNPFPDEPFTIENNPGNFNPFLINVQSPDASTARSMEILNWLVGEEGFLLTHYGKEGEHYTRSGSRITLKPEAYNEAIARNGNFLALYAQFTPYEPETLGLTVVGPDETDRDRAIVRQLRSYKKWPSIGTALSVSEGLDLPTLSKKSTDLINKMIFEDKSGANWPAYRQELIDRYGLHAVMTDYANQVSRALGKRIVPEP